MGLSLRAGHSLLLATLLPLLSLAGPAQAGSSSQALGPSQNAAPASAPQSGTPPEGQSSTPSLGEALKPSSPEQIALANHLRQQGAVFYGAYWCSHCFHQKNLFGQQAGDRLPYVECAKDQAGADKCDAAKVRAYPTWVLGNERREGVQTLEELAFWTGFPGFGAGGGKGQARGLTPSGQSPQANPDGSAAPATTAPRIATP
ncbi:MAG: hypothetical protein WAM11_05605 [Cyanobium sp.]